MNRAVSLYSVSAYFVTRFSAAVITASGLFCCCAVTSAFTASASPFDFGAGPPFVFPFCCAIRADAPSIASIVPAKIICFISKLLQIIVSYLTPRPVRQPVAPPRTPLPPAKRFENIQPPSRDRRKPAPGAPNRPASSLSPAAQALVPKSSGTAARPVRGSSAMSRSGPFRNMRRCASAVRRSAAKHQDKASWLCPNRARYKAALHLPRFSRRLSPAVARVAAPSLSPCAQQSVYQILLSKAARPRLSNQWRQPSQENRTAWPCPVFRRPA